MTKGLFKLLLVPGGLLLLAAMVIFQGGFPRISIPAIQFYFYSVFLAGSFLAWRFHSSRVLFSLITLFLAFQALAVFSPARSVVLGHGGTAFEAVAFLIPLNLIYAAFRRERGLSFSATGSGLAVLFFESVFVAVICRPGNETGLGIMHKRILGQNRLQWIGIPHGAIAIFAIVFALLLARLLVRKDPVENGLLWSSAAAFLALNAGGLGPDGEAYFATAGLVLVVSIVESTYALAYRDELTGLPSRRAFNDATQTLIEPYAIAALDIDHFKNFNDTYGHETGDQVLRLVAGKLAAVTGGGRAFRVGGEEFSILFSNKSAEEAFEHLETLRSTIENARFRVRTQSERRNQTRGPDRRDASAVRKEKRRTQRRVADRSNTVSSEQALSLTVSIGIAQATPKTSGVAQVIECADKALYRAKRGGRNRVELYRQKPLRRRSRTSLAS